MGRFVLVLDFDGFLGWGDRVDVRFGLCVGIWMWKMELVLGFL